MPGKRGQNTPKMRENRARLRDSVNASDAASGGLPQPYVAIRYEKHQ